jgi:hypothetical protein
VVDVFGEAGVGLGIIERIGEDLLDAVRRRLDAARTSQILTEGLSNQVAERHASGPGGLRSAPVQISRKKQLGPVHV